MVALKQLTNTDTKIDTHSAITRPYVSSTALHEVNQKKGNEKMRKRRIECNLIFDQRNWTEGRRRSGDGGHCWNWNLSVSTGCPPVLCVL